MKKLLTLVLCWLLAFSAMAETTLKAKTAASVAGGYVTSLNKVDGSFEDVVTQWVTSVGTIVPTDSTIMQGEKIGVWSGTGTGTLDLQWTATSSNTYEASAQVDVQGEDDVYVCAYVGTTETGCKLIPALSKIQKVSVVADSVMSSAFYLRLKHTGSDAFNVKVDDGKIEPWTPQAVNLEIKESITYIGYTSGTTGGVKFKTPAQDSGSSLVTANNTGSFTKFTINKPCYVVVQSSADYSASGSYYYRITHYNSSGTAYKSSLNNTTTYAASGIGSLTTYAISGDYFVVTTNAPPLDNTGTNFSITASAISENVVQSWQDGMATWSATSTIQIGATTTAPTKGTTDLDQVRFVRNGADVLFWYQYNQTGAGTAGSGDYLFSLPSGLQFNPNYVTYYTTIEGGADAWTPKNAIPAGTLGVTGGYMYSLYVIPYDATRFRLGMIGGVQASTISNGVMGSGFQGLSAASNSFSFKFSASILGISSTPTLLALPTSKENVFSANIANNGTASVTYKNVDWIQSVTRSALGVVDVVFKSGLFSVPPTITLGAESISKGRILNYHNLSSSGVSISTLNDAGSAYDIPFSISVQKQSPDYTAPGVFVGNVAKNQVATLYANPATVASIAGGFVDLTWDGSSGDTSIITHTAGQANFTLQPGEYLIESEGLCYKTNAAYHQLYSVTTASIIENTVFAYANTVVGEVITKNGGKFMKLSVMSPTVFKIRQFAYAAHPTGFGDVNWAWSTRAKLQITKLNGQ